MNLIVPKVISPDSKKEMRFPKFKYDIEIIDLASQKVLHQRTDTLGFHSCGLFTENENIVIYLSFDDQWRFAPTINIWELRRNTVEEFYTSHNAQELHLNIIYHAKMQRIALGGESGSISVFDIKTRKELWCHEQNDMNNINSLSFSECGDKISALQKIN